KPRQGGASSGTSSPARAQSSASMAGLGRRKGEAPVVTPKGLDRGKVGFAIASYAPYALSAANWPRRGALRSGGYLTRRSVGIIRPPATARTGIRHSRNGRYGIFRRGSCGSLRLDVGGPDHIAPFLGFFGDQLAELGRRSRQRRSAEVSETRLRLR